MIKINFLVLYFFIMSVSLFGQNESNSSYQVMSINEVKLNKLIAERNGKALLLNLWATWCIPCREEFPDLINLSNKFENKLDVIGISVDYPYEVETKIMPFLEKMGINFPVFVNRFNKEEEMIIYLNKDWNGAIPATFIYDRQGEFKSFLQGKQSEQSLTNAVLEAL